MSYAYSWPEVGDYQTIEINGVDVSGTILSLGPVITHIRTEDAMVVTVLTTDIEEWAEAAPGWLASILDTDTEPSSDVCPIHGAGCEAWS